MVNIPAPPPSPLPSFFVLLFFCRMGFALQPTRLCHHGQENDGRLGSSGCEVGRDNQPFQMAVVRISVFRSDPPGHLMIHAGFTPPSTSRWCRWRCGGDGSRGGGGGDGRSLGGDVGATDAATLGAASAIASAVVPVLCGGTTTVRRLRPTVHHAGVLRPVLCYEIAMFPFDRFVSNASYVWKRRCFVSDKQCCHA